MSRVLNVLGCEIPTTRDLDNAYPHTEDYPGQRQAYNNDIVYTEIERIADAQGYEVYYLSFGVKYKTEPHPTKPDLADPDGLVAILARSYDQARSLAVREFGVAWSMLYAPDDIDRTTRRRHFPKGVLEVFKSKY